MNIKDQIKDQLEKLHSVEDVKNYYASKGYDKDIIEAEIENIQGKKKVVNYSIILGAVVLVFSLFFFKPVLTGLVAYEGTPDLNITIWSNDDDYLFSTINVYAGEKAYFYANLTNQTNVTVSSASCNLTINDTPYYMSYSDGLYRHNLTAQPDTYTYSINCSDDTYGYIGVQDSIVIQSPPSCTSDLNVTAIFSAGEYCDTLTHLNIQDVGCVPFPPPGNCWNGYNNASLYLPAGLNTSVNQIWVLDPMDGNDDVDPLNCINASNHFLNVTFANATHKCMVNVSVNVSSYSTTPNLAITFPIMPNNMTIGSYYLVNITINNTGDDNATSISGNLTSSNSSVGSIINGSVNISNIINGSETNFTLNISFVGGGDSYLEIARLDYSRSNGFSMTPISGTGNTFHINYDPVLTLPNFTLTINSSNSTNLSLYYNDEDTYDDPNNVNWSYFSNIIVNVSLNYSTMVVNISASNVSGVDNITFQVIDVVNGSTNQTIQVFVSNGTNETCNNLDDNGDSRIDEGNITEDCCDYSSCSPMGEWTCLPNGTWSSCEGQEEYVPGGGGRGGDKTLIVQIDPNGETDPVIEESEPEPVLEPVLEQQAPQQTSSNDFEYEDISEKIIAERYSHYREIIVSGGRTQITEVVKNIDFITLDDVNIRIDIPKSVVEQASDLIEIDEFEIIREDPIINFRIGNIDPIKTVKVQYAMKNELRRIEIDQIITSISAAEINKQKRQKDIEEQIEETKKHIEIEQEIKVNYEENQTEFTIKVDYDETDTVVGDVYIYTEIPKCLIEIIKEELIESEHDFEIVAEDPLIVWHFDSLLDVKEINYNIKAIADEDCANKARSIAIAKKIVQLKFSPKRENIFLLLIPIPVVIFIMMLFGIFSKEIEHYDPKIRKLISYVKHHFKHGFKEDHIKEKLLEKGYTEKTIDEAMKLNSKNKFHYIMQKFEIGFEEFVLFVLIVLNILDFTEFLPGDADYVKKIISWTILAFVLYHVSITNIILGMRKKWVDVGLILSFFLLIMKNMVGFANAVFIEARNQGALITDLYAFIVQNNQIFEVYCFIAGIILLTLIALYLALNEEVFAPSLLDIVHFHPSKSKNPFKIIWRFIITKLTLLAFFVVIFNLVMEWLAIAVDALILVLVIGFVFYLLIKHRKRFTPSKIMYDIVETSEKFYEKFINLFHYKKTILLGISGMLILHILTELGNYLIPYITGIHDAIYFGNFNEGHLPLFNLLPSSTRGLFQLQAAGLPLVTQTLIFAGFLLNILGILYLIILPSYTWFHMFKNRKLPIQAIPKLILSKLHVFLATVSITFTLMKPAFAFKSLNVAGLIGVDIQTRFLNLDGISWILGYSLVLGLVMVFLSKPLRGLIKKMILTASFGFFGFYIYLFFKNTVVYYLTTIGSLLGENITIAVYLVIFLVINIGFYSLGMVALFIELYLRKEIWFENLKINALEGKSHHHLPHIHHYASHKEHIHGDEEKHLHDHVKKAVHHTIHNEEILQKYIEEGVGKHELYFIEKQLIDHGWPKDLIDKAINRVKEHPEVERALSKYKDPRYTEAIRNLTDVIQKSYNKGISLDTLYNSAIKKGWKQEDVMSAILKLKVDGFDEMIRKKLGS